ncbi:NACHT, LRR and PYD domains-containing protein 12-like isoform 7-T12 [Menidia menidia]
MDRGESEALNRHQPRPPDLRAGPGPSDSKGQSHRQRAEHPESDCVSVKSDRSMDKPPGLRDGPGPSDTKGQSHRQRAEYPESDCVSVKSDRSMDKPPGLRDGPGPSDTKGQSHRQRAEYPESDCLSVKSDRSMDKPPGLRDGPGPSDTKGQSHRQRAEYPESDCVSVKSDRSMDKPPGLRDGPGPSDTKGQSHTQRAEYPESDCVSVKSDRSMDKPPGLRDGPGPSETKGRLRSGVWEEEQLSSCALCQDVLKDPVSTSCGHQFCRQCSSSYWDQSASSVDPPCPQCGERTRTEAADVGLQQVLEEHKLSLRSRCEHVTEGFDGAGSGTLLNRVYTELYIIEGLSEELKAQHEVMQLETASRSLQDAHIRCHDIFKASADQPGAIRVVLTYGVAGVGKTFSVLKFTLDWAEGLENQDISVVVLLPFRELNLLRDEQCSLLWLLGVFHPALKGLRAEQLAACRLLLIFDGLDESRLSLDFTSSPVLTDLTQKSPVSLLLTNLIRGDLLPSARLWITSRPAAANQIPPACLDRLTEVRGFTDPQKEEYFRRRFRDEERSSRITSHIRSSRRLYTMCAVPIFCWISATVLEDMLSTQQVRELPTTMTELFSHFLLVQTKKKNQKYHEGQQTIPQELMDADRELLLKLGRLAFEHLVKGSILFYQEDLEQCGVDVTDASVYSGVCTEIFKRECGIFQKPVYCFVHLSVQEFLAAVYMFHCYNKKTDGMDNFIGRKYEYPSLKDFLKIVMTKACFSANGHLDLFFRFLHGLCVESNHRLLADLLGPADHSPDDVQNVIEDLKSLDIEMPPDRSINVFLCLMEMKDPSVYQEIQNLLKSKRKSKKKLTMIQCSALAYMLQMSEEVLDELDPQSYNTTEEGRRRLIPAVRNCRKARFADCGLSGRDCEAVASALKSSPSHLKDLDLSRNMLMYTGGKHLSAGLESPNCRLETLRLADCGLAESVCEAAASALKSSPSHLKELDLSRNRLMDTGGKDLSAGLESPNCRLETLSLSSCGISEEGCSSLASAVTSNPSHLKELDLSSNRPGDSGVKLLMAALKDPHKLRLAECGLSESVCEAVASALKSSPSHLKELDLSRNRLMDTGGKDLSVGLESPNCRLETLRLEGCSLSETSLASLVSALKSNPSHLTELDLSWNNISECVMKELSSFLQSPLCGLKTLRLQCCGLSNISGASLVTALKSKSSRLTELDLRYNHNLQESVTKQLSELVESPDYKLKTLRLERCCVSEISCAPLVAALESNPSDLRELDLSKNNLKDSEVKQLCGLLGSHLCRLETMRLQLLELSGSSCASLVSALKSNPSHLTELDLSQNNLTGYVMKELSSFLQSPLCGLKTLRLGCCNLSEISWASLFSALKSNPSHLTELDLKWNNLSEFVMKELSSFLQSPLCGLKTLRMGNCNLSKISWTSLFSALKSNPSNLTELDLSQNNISDCVMKELSSFLQSPLCGLKTLRLMNCSFSEIGWTSLVSALKSNPSHLITLDLCKTRNISDFMMKELSSFLQSPLCRLKILSLKCCRLSEISCASLVSALKSNSPHLIGLDLSQNNISDCVMEELSSFLQSPLCGLGSLISRLLFFIQLGGLRVVRDQLCFSGLSSEIQPLTSDNAVPGFQQPEAVRCSAAVGSGAKSTQQTTDSEMVMIKRRMTAEKKICVLMIHRG